MSFRISGLPAEDFVHLFSLSDEKLAAQGGRTPDCRREDPRLSLSHKPHRFPAGRRTAARQLRASPGHITLPHALRSLCP